MSKSESFQDVLQTYYRRDLGRMYPLIQPDKRRLTHGRRSLEKCLQSACCPRSEKEGSHP